MGEAGGRVILMLIKKLRRERGEEGWARVQERLPATVREALSQRLSAAEFYPYEIYAHLLEAAAEGLPDPVAFWRLLGFEAANGGWAADFDLMTEMKPKDVVMAMGFIWSMLHKGGRVAIPRIKDNEAEVVVEDAPFMCHAHCHVVMGWLDSGYNMLNLPHATAELIECPHTAPDCKGTRYRMRY
jgi:hypothetical protein